MDTVVYINTAALARASIHAQKEAWAQLIGRRGTSPDGSDEWFNVCCVEYGRWRSKRSWLSWYLFVAGVISICMVVLGVLFPLCRQNLGGGAEYDTSKMPGLLLLLFPLVNVVLFLVWLVWKYWPKWTRCTVYYKIINDGERDDIQVHDAVYSKTAKPSGYRFLGNGWHTDNYSDDRLIMEGDKVTKHFTGNSDPSCINSHTGCWVDMVRLWDPLCHSGGTHARPAYIKIPIPIALAYAAFDTSDVEELKQRIGGNDLKLVSLPDWRTRFYVSCSDGRYIDF